jgi:hypothetical protein
MPFTEMYSTTIYEWNSYSKKVTVLLSTGDDGKGNSYWVDIKTNFNDGEKIKTLMYGVCLEMSELEKLLPNMMALKHCEVKNDRRRIWFMPRERHIAQRKILLHDIRVCKANGDESRISLSNDDIEKINSIKDKIFDCINKK